VYFACFLFPLYYNEGMNESFEDKYLDILQNIEFALAQVYRREEGMTDWEASQAVNGAIRRYTAEQRRRPAPALNLSPLALEAYDGVVAMCEMRLGRVAPADDEGNEIPLAGRPLTVGEIVDCLKRIRKSIEHWNKEGGRRGYFEFVKGFLP
jgi:hypothetical protein